MYEWIIIDLIRARECFAIELPPITGSATSEDGAFGQALWKTLVAT